MSNHTRDFRAHHNFQPVFNSLLCELCNQIEQIHRSRDRVTRNRVPAKNRYAKSYKPSKPHPPPPYKYIGIDGEGLDRDNHRYVLMCASTADGEEEWSVDVKDWKTDRLTTAQCLDLILSLPTHRTRIFSYSFNYDITKMLTDLDNRSLYLLFRPELRKRSYKSYTNEPVKYTPKGESEPYLLDLMGTKFIVKRGGKRVVVWDLFKFFQAKFVGALKDWKVGTPELWERMSKMKDKRSNLDRESPLDVRNYCLEETRCMAQLAEKLIQSHTAAGLKLKAFYGAGSSGAAMLDAMGLKGKIPPALPEMKEAVASAFFGGRFENSVIGGIREYLHGWDISSAYVYQLAFLPCLEHGTWTHTKKRSDLSRAECQSGALVRYTLGSNPGIGAWGPFPFRTAEGSIAFPIESGGGWVWLDEYLAGERIFPHVRFKEAWIYSSNCNCKPFGKIPEYYNLRLQIGKEGPGIVIKLGMNSCYGKLAQSVGNAKYQSWIWAGMITSGCRAQILQMMGLHEDMSNLLMVATDGILTREELKPPVPLPTGTDKLIGDMKVSKPLGGWEYKPNSEGVFIARPGIYFPMHPTAEEIKSIRARGVGRSVVLEHWEHIIRTWERDGVKGIAAVPNVSRFCGGKTSISCSGKPGFQTYKRAGGNDYEKQTGFDFMKNENPGKRPAYGQWISRKVEMSFDPMPKRAGVNPDGLTLALRKFSPNHVSCPYDRAVMLSTPEALEMKAAQQELLEQPEADLIDYEDNS